MKKTNKLALLAASKGATGKLPSYMKKFVPKGYAESNTVSISAAEEVLFGESEKKGRKISNNKVVKHDSNTRSKS